MDVKKLVLLIGALVMAGVSAFMARSLFAGAAAPEAMAAPADAVPTGPEVLVATRPLPVGTIIGPESLKYQPWPKDLVQQAYFIKGESDAASLQGTVVRTEITAGQPITQGSLVKPGDRGFLAAALGPGMRAITISVSNQAGNAGFVFPGDRVDLMLSSDVQGGGDGPALKATETIMRNLRVLATDQRTEKGVDENGKSVVATFSTVTLEVTPRIAEKIAVAQSVGTLSLALRPLADNTAELEAAIAAGDVKVPETDDPRAEKKMLLEVASRPIDGGGSYATGADVSRFQRSSVPGRSAERSAPAFAGVPMAAPAAPAAVGPDGSAPMIPRGPVVRIARGNNVTVIPVTGGK
ncbi:Flp pilus assembly protein CpaB [Sphingomonas jatrophae]|uniref:Pilus assembly protein CpaB n=1 Tax=Sphingomonas jatrophae TaxID=1166337 RepID=A0A1I6JU25_9SPHN|nr:Flp pilus assembly protein CpaB [Sphingomonas jatrophae]SFR82515.1 pilus assembly protein CpaB [Sphingomonas jatrophae]